MHKLGSSIVAAEKIITPDVAESLGFWQICMVMVWIKSKSKSALPGDHYIKQEYLR